ncbi:MAG: NTP transferase domain-containing protein [Mucilaginibacter polytrichastri]|nr:NTP transferase domain-containing protein [Mucilaginibacter polytrichastri]
MHEKHAKLKSPVFGEYARIEFALLGTSCSHIRELAGHLISRLTTSFHIGFVDADHHAPEISQDDFLHDGVCLQLNDKISYTQITFPEKLNQFEQRNLFQAQDLVLINGNHYRASRQIVILDPKKSLKNKIDRLTDVRLILQTGENPVPDYLHFLREKSTPVLHISDLDAIAGFLADDLDTHAPVLNGLVLAGGKSTRMGRDKSALKYHESTQAAHVFSQLGNMCAEVFLSCNSDQRAVFTPNFPVIEDSFTGLGPLGGILSAMQKDPNAAWLTVACDLPLLSTDTLQFLKENRNPRSVATAFYDAQHEFPEPLITIWEPKAYARLLLFLAQGYSCPRKALINSDVTLLEAPDKRELMNANHPQEYQEVMEILHSTKKPETDHV